jgi:type I restriction enzyme S subunit
MQQLFPQEGESVPRLRFEGFKGDWAESTLDKLANRITQKNKAGTVIRVLTNSALYGILDQRDYFDKDIANPNNLEGYYVVDKYDYVYNPRVSTIAPVGPISKNKIGKGVMSPLYTVFKNKNNDFYEQFFKSTYWHSYLNPRCFLGYAIT